AEDGIRDATVTGVQTCALPISTGEPIELMAQTALLLATAPAAGCRSRDHSLPQQEPLLAATPPVPRARWARQWDRETPDEACERGRKSGAQGQQQRRDGQSA